MHTMKALRFETYGPPSVLLLEDVELPAPGPEEVLIEVYAAAINPSDAKNVAGAFKATTPRIPGRDYAGVVISGGDGWKGRQVWGSGPGFGMIRDGAHAQFVLVPIDGLSVKPLHPSMEEAAAVGVPYLAAWSALVDGAQIQSGETILITGVAGAVGRAATQIAHWRGAKVIGADIVESQSEVDHFLDAKGKDLSAEVKSLTSGAGVDLALDCVGGPMFEPSLGSLRRGGRQVAISSVGNRRVQFDLIDFYHEERRLIGVDTIKLTGSDIARVMDHLRDGFDRGHLKPSVTASWPLRPTIRSRAGPPQPGRFFCLGGIEGACARLDGGCAGAGRLGAQASGNPRRIDETVPGVTAGRRYGRHHLWTYGGAFACAPSHRTDRPTRDARRRAAPAPRHAGAAIWRNRNELASAAGCPPLIRRTA